MSNLKLEARQDIRDGFLSQTELEIWDARVAASYSPNVTLLGTMLGMPELAEDLQGNIPGVKVFEPTVPHWYPQLHLSAESRALATGKIDVVRIQTDGLAAVSLGEAHLVVLRQVLDTFFGKGDKRAILQFEQNPDADVTGMLQTEKIARTRSTGQEDALAFQALCAKLGIPVNFTIAETSEDIIEGVTRFISQPAEEVTHSFHRPIFINRQISVSGSSGNDKPDSQKMALMSTLQEGLAIDVAHGAHIVDNETPHLDWTIAKYRIFELPQAALSMVKVVNVEDSLGTWETVTRDLVFALLTGTHVVACIASPGSPAEQAVRSHLDALAKEYPQVDFSRYITFVNSPEDVVRVVKEHLPVLPIVERAAHLAHE